MCQSRESSGHNMMVVICIPIELREAKVHRGIYESMLTV